MTDSSSQPACPAIAEGLEEAAALIADADPILITSHRGPDGDGVGCMLALADALTAAGKQVTVYSPDPIPRYLKWLPGASRWRRKLPPTKRYQLTLVVDCGDAKLLGGRFPAAEVTGKVIALDHHASARPFGDLFLSDPSAAATGVLVDRLLQVARWPLSKDAAQCLWVALISDTGSFRHSNTNAEAMALGARLVCEHGVEPGWVSEALEQGTPLRRYKLMARVFERIEMEHDGKIALMTVTQEHLDEAGAAWEDTEGLVNYARALEGVECGVLLTPAKWGGIRVSVRSRGHAIDAGSVCMELGGGGHRGAGGCTIPGDMSSARQEILEALGASLAKPN